MNEIDDEIVQRMVKLVRAMDRACHPTGWLHYDEAHAIVSLLPEPVDPDAELAKKLAIAAESDFVTPLPSARLERLQGHILSAIKRGRELARQDKGRE